MRTQLILKWKKGTIKKITTSSFNTCVKLIIVLCWLILCFFLVYLTAPYGPGSVSKISDSRKCTAYCRPFTRGVVSNLGALHGEPGFSHSSKYSDAPVYPGWVYQFRKYVDNLMSHQLSYSSASALFFGIISCFPPDQLLLVTSDVLSNHVSRLWNPHLYSSFQRRGDL